MPNLSRRVTGTYSIPDFINDARAAANTQNCIVGVMVQYGKTLISPLKWRKTMGGGHVCVFVLDSNGYLQTWDEVKDESWQSTIEDSSNEMPGQADDCLFRHSNLNDVSVYLHPATHGQVMSVVQRAQSYETAGNLKYSHLPSVGKPVKHGDCVTRSSWVMSAFSYVMPVRGGKTPWGESTVYEVYTAGINVFSKWVKIKYKGAKLPVMG